MKKKSKRNLVKFTSSTALLDFDGITNNIDGYFYWESKELFSQKNKLYFEIDLNSVQTGIGKRDRDMRQDVLETDKWPKTSFKGTIQNVEANETNKNQYIVISVGKIFIHGHEKDLKIRAKIGIEDTIMTVSCDFSVFLKDYEIEAPSLLAFIKVAEEIKLHLNFYLERISESKN